MVTINDSTIRANVFKTIYDTLNLASSTLTPSTADVVSGYPDLTNITFPLICIMPTNISEEEFTIDTTRTTSTKMIPVVIWLFAEKYNQLDTLTDGVMTTIKSTSMPGLCLNNTNEDDGYLIPNNSKLKQKTLTLNFLRR